MATHDKSGNLQLFAQSINELIGSVSTTVGETTQIVRRSVEGNLTARLNVDNKLGDFKVLAASVNSMIQSVMEMVGGLTKTSLAVQSRAEEIARGNHDLSKRTAEQASGIEQVNRAVAAMDAMTQKNATMVEEAAEAAQAMNEEASSLMELIAHYRIS